MRCAVRDFLLRRDGSHCEGLAKKRLDVQFVQVLDLYWRPRLKDLRQVVWKLLVDRFDKLKNVNT